MVEEVSTTNELYVLGQELEKKKIEEILEGMDVDKGESERIIVVENAQCVRVLPSK